jgi:glutamate-ammonia-ligase adenylyltransferase
MSVADAGAADRPLADLLSTAPHPDDRRRAERRVADWLSTIEAADGAALAAQAPVRDLLRGIADQSPFLWQLIVRDPPRLVRLLHAPPQESFETCLRTTRAACGAASSEAAAMRVLRRAKQEVALLVALADLGGVWNLAAVTASLSEAADVFVAAALERVLCDLHAAGKLSLPDPAEAQARCGLVVLALGKHGARELNYSSDVDLVVFYDPDSPALPKGADAAPLFVQVTRRLVRLLQERTADGYVFRVDLRLRPDPGSTAVAVALPAAFSYYEMLGQNWERAAFIKARPVAGDIALGQAFLRELGPFIWRKYFDYAAIADIHAMKRQIHAVRGYEDIAVAGHDLKLGRGGIREIEFFVQTQQLIFGGKRPSLRGARTLDMLRALLADGWVTATAVDELSAAYAFLRRLEHRLQMVADEQTQRLPGDQAGLRRFARFCGYARLAAFEAACLRHFRRVVAHYALLFEDAPALDTAAGSLVFVGPEDDPETLQTLAQAGFKHPAVVAETVRGWHFGRRPAVRGPRAREVLTELVPSLLMAFAGSGDPDAAVAAFDTALAHMPAAVELFAILRSNAKLRDLFADVLGNAPPLARVVMRRPHVLDAALDPAFFEAPFDEDAFGARLRRACESVATVEDFLDVSRDFVEDERFTIGVRALSGTMDSVATGRAYSALAACVVATTLHTVAAAFATEHGRVAGGRCAVMALGKLGSREMTAASDLDLMLIYDFDPARPDSDGARPLHAAQYYTRLTQRLVSALTVATRRGRLYEVDMRLRPSGRQGPLATAFASFVAYQESDADDWEHMALTRARVIAGDPGLAAAIAAALAAVLGRPADGVKLRRNVTAMRALIAKEKGDAGPWDLKLVAGGLIDIEFIAQYLQLAHAHADPAVLDVSTIGALSKARDAGFLAAPDADVLIGAHGTYGAVVQIMRLTLEPDADPATAIGAIQKRLAKAADLPAFAQLVVELRALQRAVRGVFNRTLSVH